MTMKKQITLSQKKIYQQIDLIKLKDVNVLPLEKIRKKLVKKFEKMLLAEENNEIGEELNGDEI